MTVPVLTITGMNLPPYAVRGATQTWKPIGGASQTARTVNGDLQDVSDPIFRKLATVISCTDQEVPEFIWPGAAVTVNCVAELSVFNEDPEDPMEDLTLISLPKTPVSGSLRRSGDYVFYRPSLSMMVIDLNIDYDEWKKVVGWSLSLEEV